MWSPSRARLAIVTGRPRPVGLLAVDIHRSTTCWQIAPTTHYDTSAGSSHGRTTFRDLRHRALSAVLGLSRKAPARPHDPGVLQGPLILQTASCGFSFSIDRLGSLQKNRCPTSKRLRLRFHNILHPAMEIHLRTPVTFMENESVAAHPNSRGSRRNRLPKP